MRLTKAETIDAAERTELRSTISRTASHCWALLQVTEWILQHIGEPTEPPTVLVDEPANPS